MSSAIEQKIQHLSDGQTIAAITELFDSAFELTDIDAIRSSAAAQAPELVRLDEETLELPLSAARSVELARHLLCAFARTDELQQLATHAVDTVLARDDMALVETVLALGLVVNVTLLFATTSAEIKTPFGTFRKAKVDPELMRSVLEPVTELVKTHRHRKKRD